MAPVSISPGLHCIDNRNLRKVASMRYRAKTKLNLNQTIENNMIMEYSILESDNLSQ
jgi:hypothetical protein